MWPRVIGRGGKATREDAERVVSAEMRNKLDLTTTPGGVAEAVGFEPT